MFSITTIASSTTKPVEIVSAINERLSTLYSHKYMTPKVPMSEIGTTISGITVARQFRRKTNTTRITSNTEMSSVSSTSWTDARIVVVRLSTTDMLIADEIEACNCGIAAFTRSTVSIMLAPGAR